MSYLQNSFTKLNSQVFSYDFAPLIGEERTTELNIAFSGEDAPLFLIGQSRVIGFKRVSSSPDVADNGKPYILYICPEDYVHFPGIRSVITIASDSGTDTSQYRMYWMNEEPNLFIKEELDLV
jgi:hypothetical protein